MPHLLLTLEDLYGDDRKLVEQGIVALIKLSPRVVVDAMAHLLQALKSSERLERESAAKCTAALIDLSSSVVGVVGTLQHLLLALEDTYGDDPKAVGRALSRLSSTVRVWLWMPCHTFCRYSRAVNGGYVNRWLRALPH